ncbi:MAG: hypothetical protein Q8K72_11210 [Acidimicrobiales bacterium]|nr:hypothetical protein [Acidimicrobiales bacterium]
METPDGPPLERDDRVLRTTRAVSIVIVPVLTAAFVILFLFPGQTRTLWGWTIRSRMSCMFMGGGYLAGALFFARASRAKEWHRLGPGIIATTVFAGALGVATFLHWSEFNHGHVSFWAWTLLYITTPLLLPVLYVKNRQFDPGTRGPEDVPIPAWIRRTMTVVGAGQLLFAVTLYLRPSLFLADWPWTLTTISARSLAAFAAFPAITYLAFAFEHRWSALRWPFETAIAGVALIAVGAARSSGDFKGGAQSLLWRAGLIVALAFLITVWLTMRRKVRLASAP